jgi:pyridoxal phosphate enzyme (YggS family)
MAGMDAERVINVSERLASVRGRIAAACRAAGRAPASVRLVAVTKGFDTATIRPALLTGQSEFGENRVQEARTKWPGLKDEFPGITLHLIGPLQSNKAAEAVALADVIHTVDREKIAAALAAERARQQRTPRLLVQVNTGAEPQKAGVPPEETDAFVARCLDTHGLAIGGLMCIPPLDEPPAPHFALLAAIAKRLGLAELSMGMSEDFETAIALGATMVRIGSAIFGARPQR